MMKACIWKFSLLLAVLALVGISPSSAAAVSSSSPGFAWAWGQNDYGQLGSNSMDQSVVPVAVQMPENVAFTVISAGYDHSLALDTAGHAWAWGKGPLGSRSTNGSLVPVAVEMPPNIAFTTISAGSEDSLALDTAGVAWAWGRNDYGQLGNNSTLLSPAPVAVQMPMNVMFTRISAGTGYSLALDAAGHAWAWGANDSGQLGSNGTDQSLVPVAVQMPPSVTFTMISASGGRPGYSLALDTAGHAWAWSANDHGQLGSNSTDQSLVPVAVQMPANVAFTTISAGYDHSLALDTAGLAWAWGNNWSNELGANIRPFSVAPVAVQMPANVTFATISAGEGYCLALDTAGHGWAWGTGPLGNNRTNDAIAEVPVALQMSTSVTFTMISAGAYHSLALQHGSDL
ncbi:MAG TPA: hypothetical protein VKQ30_06815 [Ktedonobacterales bacterium]|nr:hypothetical protein [Ktedonobacterales bacterium]